MTPLRPLAKSYTLCQSTNSVACAGTGKSSFVCAICVGLGGSLKVGSAAFAMFQLLDLKGAPQS